jgi:transcriptional regulator with XRE-family HTH domain
MNTIVQNVRKTSVYAEEALVVDLQSMLHTVMVERGFTRSQLAEAMNVSKARVTQLFSADCSNFTVRLLARALFALGEKLEVSCPTHERVKRRMQVTHQLLHWATADRQYHWNVPANDQTLVAKTDTSSTHAGGLIARAMRQSERQAA